MAKLIFGLNVSLDGYVDHQAFAPGPALFRHFIEDMRGLHRANVEKNLQSHVDFRQARSSS